MAYLEPAEWAAWYAPRWPRKAAEYIARHEDSANDADRAKAAALKVELPAIGRCRICGRRLTDAESLARGIGPECWSKLAAA